MNKNHAVLAVFIIAFLARIAALAVLPERGITGDSQSYDDLAVRIAQGHGYTSSLAPDLPATRRLPGYPVFLAVIYFIFGHSLAAVKILQFILDSSTCVLLYKTAELLFGKRIALWAALLAALYPPYILFANFILSEALYLFLVALSGYLMVKGFKGEGKRDLILSGFFMGISNLVRSTLMLFPAALFVALITFAKRSRKRLAVSFAIFISCMVLAMSPWIIRNYLCFHKIMLSHQGLGWALWVGSTDFKDQFYPHWDQEPVKSMIKDANSVDDIDRIFLPKAIKNITQNPFAYITLIMKKFFSFWTIPYGLDLVSAKSELLGILYRLFYYVVFFFFLAGVFLADKKERAISAILILMLYFSVFHAILIMEPRYSFPVNLYIFIFAAFGFQNFSNIFNLKRGHNNATK
ncbi:MAG: glycosyltransferase family 39 protein [Candidatus Omnitrophota bacterium]